MEFLGVAYQGSVRDREAQNALYLRCSTDGRTRSISTGGTNTSIFEAITPLGAGWCPDGQVHLRMIAASTAYNLDVADLFDEIHRREAKERDGVAPGIELAVDEVAHAGLMEDAFPSNIYAQSYWLWAVPFVLTIWAARIWLIAGRGELDEDPVAFAIKDRFSWGLAVPLAIAFALATIRWP